MVLNVTFKISELRRMDTPDANNILHIKLRCRFFCPNAGSSVAVENVTLHTLHLNRWIVWPSDFRLNDPYFCEFFDTQHALVPLDLMPLSYQRYAQHVKPCDDLFMTREKPWNIDRSIPWILEIFANSVGTQFVMHVFFKYHRYI